ncbi:hypothetical protein LTR78_008075 [Recurvomyces mirabilis]|uniref:Geranylgeranyl pyrophosphate synthetase n=1 Tax=Recurvomyces mirabilis TaxID=574656 RepID=A0AAE0WHV4_9PEZI|nr:hypothetical protein LTR78_008075 [Recurvomyces mirabilis]KAK5150802.1 hypothetical protein LTS14_009866 [Recurvomyces mirabilis]
MQTRNKPYTGGQSSRWPKSKTQTAALIERPPSPSVGPLVETWTLDSLRGLAKISNTTIAKCESIASFNWLDKKDPTIVVPGGPPVWTPLSEPVQLQEDSGDYLRDPNGARYPTNPLDPAVWALLVQKSSFQTSEVDIFACGSTLGNLLRFVRKVDKPFRFTIQKVGNTVFFVRRENKHDERIIGVRGYGHSFPEAYTKWSSEVKGSASHQRLIKYDFDGLACVVRFEGDGYLPDLASADEHDETSPLTIPELARLSMQLGGRPVPQEAIFDLKTRSVRRILNDVLGEELPRLWLTQIPNFILAFHDRGTFHDIRVQDVRKEVQNWEKQNQGMLQQFAALLRKLVDHVMDSPDGRCEVRCKRIGILEIRTQLDDAPVGLSKELHEVWTRGPWSPPTSDDECVGGGAVASTSDNDSADDGVAVDIASFSDDESADFTACSPACGYCGKC